MAIALIALKSIPANSNKLRACTPYSSTVRARAVVKRQCATSSVSLKTPSEVFVFPASITSSISGFLNLRADLVVVDVHDLLNQITGTSGALFTAQSFADLVCAVCIVGHSE